MNEYQVVYEKAKREDILKDETAKGYALLEEHEAVVLRYVTRYCPYTDGIMGNDIEVVVCGSLEEANDYLTEHDYGDDVVYYQLLQSSIEQLYTESIAVLDDDVPF